MKTGPKPTPPLKRFWPKVEQTETCWLWTGAKLDARGYGMFWDGSRPVLAHRWAYEEFIGPIPAGLVIDHLCRVPACVNPAHLEPVTNHTNVIVRGVGPAAQAARATHCPAGHEYTDASTYRVRATSATPNGSRRCRICNTAARRIYKQRRRENAGGAHTT